MPGATEAGRDKERSSLGPWGFPGGLLVKNSPVSAGNPGSTPELGRSPGEGHATHSNILACEIPERVRHNSGTKAANKRGFGGSHGSAEPC